VTESVALPPECGAIDASDPFFPATNYHSCHDDRPPRGCWKPTARPRCLRTRGVMDAVEKWHRSCREDSTMSSVPFDAPPSLWRKTKRASVEANTVTNGARVTLGLHDDEQFFEVPARLFEQLPFAVYVCDRNGLVLRYNHRAAYGGGRPSSAIPTNGFADRIKCSVPTAACCRTINAPWPTCCAPAFPCANRRFT
jgi:hypothetical protein